MPVFVALVRLESQILASEYQDKGLRSSGFLGHPS